MFFFPMERSACSLIALSAFASALFCSGRCLPVTKQSRREMSSVSTVTHKAIIITHYLSGMGNLNLNGYGEGLDWGKISWVWMWNSRGMPKRYPTTSLFIIIYNAYINSIPEMKSMAQKSYNSFLRNPKRVIQHRSSTPSVPNYKTFWHF